VHPLEAREDGHRQWSVEAVLRPQNERRIQGRLCHYEAIDVTFIYIVERHMFQVSNRDAGKFKPVYICHVGIICWLLQKHVSKIR
jgi:hypothetical protein